MKLELTDAATRFFARLLRFDGGPGYGVSLLASPGGCQGLAADFSVQAQPAAGEAVVEVQGVRLFLPAQSRLLLHGATVDFADTPTESGLVFRNVAGGGSCSSQKPTSAPALATVDVASIGRGGRP